MASRRVETPQPLDTEDQINYFCNTTQGDIGTRAKLVKITGRDQNENNATTLSLSIDEEEEATNTPITKELRRSKRQNSDICLEEDICSNLDENTGIEMEDSLEKPHPPYCPRPPKLTK